jgi:hypothetical protein
MPLHHRTAASWRYSQNAMTQGCAIRNNAHNHCLSKQIFQLLKSAFSRQRDDQDNQLKTDGGIQLPT